MEYLNQHFVTEGYIKAWLDPDTTQGAYVWVFSKKHKSIFKKSPSSLFSESDFYTVYDNRGNRILELEHKLKEIEDKFFVLRDNKLKIREPLLPNDRLTIALFVSSMFARTKFQKDIQKEIWEELLSHVDKLPEDLANFIKESAEYKQIKALHEQPMPFNLFNFVNISVPFLLGMNTCIYETKDVPGFITSDNPCLWMDPALMNPSESKNWFGLGSPKLEVILPISPTQCISLMRGNFDGYTEIDVEYAKIIEELIVSQAREKVVINKKLIKDSWLQLLSSQVCGKMGLGMRLGRNEGRDLTLIGANDRREGDLSLMSMSNRRVRLSLSQSAQESIRHIPIEIEISI